MNSRSSVNETNLVNFSADLSSLNALDSKEPLLSFPFDHIYACHADSSDRRQTIQLDKEVEISTHCLVADDNVLTDKLASLENQNKKLKDLLVYHLDLIQQQNDLISKKEKVYQALRIENDALKLKVAQGDKRVATVNRPQSLNPPPLVQLPSATITSAVKSEPPSIPQVYNSYNELFLGDHQTSQNTYLLNDLNLQQTAPKEHISYRSLSSDPERAHYMPPAVEVSLPIILEPTNVTTDTYNMIDHRRSTVKKTDTKSVESPPEPRYTVTTNSGTPVIQRIPRKKGKSTGIGSLSRMPKSQPKADDRSKDKINNTNKKSKNVNTYGSNKSPKLRYPFGPLSDRLQLIDTTPTGEDPYQLGEAEMRAQSPIPKLQKTNHGRMKNCMDMLGGVTSTMTSTTSSRRVYDTMTDRTKPARGSRKNSSNQRAQRKKEPIRLSEEVDLSIPEPDIDWQVYPPSRTLKETSLCDFSYGETSANLASELSLDMGFPDFFEPGPVNSDLLSSELLVPTSEKSVEKPKKRGTKNNVNYLTGPSFEDETVEAKRGVDSKRGRKRAHSTASTTKRESNGQKAGAKAKSVKRRASFRGKKITLPGLTTRKPYSTLMGDPDLSWYLGLDPEVKKEDVDQVSEIKASDVEVPRWREKPYTCLYSLEGTENLDDKVFEKRHQKYEAEERRQLRWHMRRVREQRHVERLRQRQRDPWSTSQPHHPPSDYTIWPQPLRDLKFIEITDTLPVLAFGEEVPAVPNADFVVPWVKTFKAQKRSKRSKTLH